MIDEIAAARLRLALGMGDRKGLGRGVDLFAGAGKADHVGREGGGKFADHLRRVAFRIERDEDRHDLRGKAGIPALEQLQALRHALHVGGADVGAEGVAEIDDPVLAGKIAPAHRLALAACEGKLAADGSAGERRFGRRRGRPAASGQRQREGNCEKIGGGRLVAAVHALLTGCLRRGTKPPCPAPRPVFGRYCERIKPWFPMFCAS